MQLDTPFDDILQSRSHVRVLRALCQLPAAWPASAREVARRAGVSHPTASKVLGGLADQGLVTRTRAPSTDSFELRRTHIAAEKLIALFEWEGRLGQELLSVLREELLERLPSPGTAAFLFGSAVRGDMTPTSDVDVAVLCPSEGMDGVAAAMEEIGERVRERFGNRLAFVLTDTPLEELMRSRRTDSQLWRRILREGIPIIHPEEAPAGG